MSTTTETPSQNVNGGGRETPGVLTRQIRPWSARPTVFVTWTTGKGVDEQSRPLTVPKRASIGQLLAGLPAGTARVILCGIRPGARGADIGTWARGELPAGWTAGGHFLKTDEPILLYAGPAGRLEIRHSSTWTRAEDHDAKPGELAAAFRLADAGIAAEFSKVPHKPGEPKRFDAMTTPKLLGSPSTTGRELLRRTLPAGHRYDPLPAGTAILIQQTARQGRNSLLAEPGAELPAVFGYDMRFAYAWAAQQVKGAGLASFDRNDPGFEPYKPGRYLAEWTVPYGWDQLAILQAEDRSWPAKPGEHGRGWVDGRELRLALDYGWDIKIRERILFGNDTARPLETWARKLVTIRNEWIPAQDDYSTRAAELARDMIRAILVSTIGSLQGRRHLITRDVPVTESRRVPKGVETRIDGDRLVWLEEQPAPDLAMVRPEWSSQIWALQRKQLLDTGPSFGQAKAAGLRGIGALHVDPTELVGLRTDAIYTTTDPGWKDTGRVGDYRLKLTHGPMLCPLSSGELSALEGGE